MNLPETVRNVYHGSDGDATKALYARLTQLGPCGELAVNLFRASKNSARAKKYRGGIRGQGSYKGMAYDRKEWAVSNLCACLVQHAADFTMRWGWQRDPATPAFEWVLYIDLPTGQVSFHSPSRGTGPDYSAPWDGMVGASADRIIRWCELMLSSGEHIARSGEPIDGYPRQGV